MSRSKKKVKIYKDSGYKYPYNHIYRSAVKQQLITDLRTKDLDEIGTLPIQKETTNQYDIVDWKYIGSKEDDNKIFRK